MPRWTERGLARLQLRLLDVPVVAVRSPPLSATGYGIVAGDAAVRQRVPLRLEAQFRRRSLPARENLTASSNDLLSVHSSRVRGPNRSPLDRPALDVLVERNDFECETNRRSAREVIDRAGGTTWGKLGRLSSRCQAANRRPSPAGQFPEPGTGSDPLLPIRTRLRAIRSCPGEATTRICSSATPSAS